MMHAMWMRKFGFCFLISVIVVTSCSGPVDKIKNGKFDTDTSGWQAFECTIAVVDGGQAGKCLEIKKKGATAQYVMQNIDTLVVGKTYKLTAHVKSGASGNEKYQICIGPACATGTSSAMWTAASVEWKATDASKSVVLMKDSPSEGTMLFDTVTLMEN